MSYEDNEISLSFAPKDKFSASQINLTDDDSTSQSDEDSTSQSDDDSTSQSDEDLSIEWSELNDDDDDNNGESLFSDVIVSESPEESFTYRTPNSLRETEEDKTPPLLSEKTGIFFEKEDVTPPIIKKKRKITEESKPLSLIMTEMESESPLWTLGKESEEEDIENYSEQKESPLRTLGEENEDEDIEKYSEKKESPLWTLGEESEEQDIEKYSEKKESPLWTLAEETEEEAKKNYPLVIEKAKKEKGFQQKRKKLFELLREKEGKKEVGKEEIDLKDMDMDKFLLENQVFKKMNDLLVIDKTVSKIIAARVRSTVEKEFPSNPKKQTMEAFKRFKKLISEFARDPVIGRINIYKYKDVPFDYYQLTEKEILEGEKPLKTSIFKGKVLYDENFAKNIPKIEDELVKKNLSGQDEKVIEKARNRLLHLIEQKNDEEAEEIFLPVSSFTPQTQKRKRK